MPKVLGFDRWEVRRRFGAAPQRLHNGASALGATSENDRGFLHHIEAVGSEVLTLIHDVRTRTIMKIDIGSNHHAVASFLHSLRHTDSSFTSPSRLVIVEHGGYEFFGRLEPVYEPGSVGFDVVISTLPLQLIEEMSDGDPASLLLARSAAASLFAAIESASDNRLHLRESCDNQHPQGIPVDSHALNPFSFLLAPTRPNGPTTYHHLYRTTASHLRRPAVTLAQSMHVHGLTHQQALRQEQAMGPTGSFAANETRTLSYRLTAGAHGEVVLALAPENVRLFWLQPRETKDSDHPLLLPTAIGALLGPQFAVLAGISLLMEPESIERMPQVFAPENADTPLDEVVRTVTGREVR